MQSLGLDIIKQTRKEKMKKMDGELVSAVGGERVLCPFCRYESRKNKLSGVVFDDGKRKTFKCFACGIWRWLG